jgi:hypothetical protein
MAYLLAIRAGVLRPTFVPVAVLALFPIAALLVPRGRRSGTAIIAVLELLATALVAAMVGVAIAWRSG